MTMKLFVAQLPFQWKNPDLEKLFASYGATGAKIITDYNTGRSKGFGFVEIPDDKLGAKAIAAKNNTIVDNSQRRIVVKEAEERGQRSRQPRTQQRITQPSNQSISGRKENPAFPYRFTPRDAGKSFGPEAKGEVEQLPFHHKLYPDRYDVAFEVEWVTKTPVAANPCSDLAETNKCFPVPEGKKDEYTGYDKRWLRVDGKLAISPFTVKSAIANGFANLLGGCIRVPTKEQPHADQGKGKYPYTGGYKRYRVGMGGQSKPGIIRSVKKSSDFWEFETEVVDREFYYRQHPLPKPANSPVYAVVNPRGRKPGEILDYDPKKKNLSRPVGEQFIPPGPIKYHGPYSWGMRPYPGGTPSVFGDIKHWRHRFYTSNPANTIKGEIPAWQFRDKSELEKLMFMGRDQRREPPDPNHDPNHRWFQEIKDLKVGDWVYFEKFNGQIGAIGKSFLFKTPFFHADTLPDAQRVCKDMRKLCPRCAMFGMTDDTGRNEKPAAGYRGRFKAGALVCQEILNPVDGLTENVPVITDQISRVDRAPIKAWGNGKDEIKCRQFLLPIQGQPQPNKRDEDAYFNKNTGCIKGVKTYRHSLKGIADLNKMNVFIEKTDRKRTLADQQPALFVPHQDQRERNRLAALKYDHSLRSWVEVCDQGMTFKGTLGAENCSEDEIAAMALLLEADVAGHGFKIGTGKALGLGSVESHIKKIWIRKPESYDKWVTIDVVDPQSLPTALQAHLPKVKAELDRLQKVSDFERRINQLDKNSLPLAYPPPGISSYWRLAGKIGLNSMP